jgi:hypothetical protein
VELDDLKARWESLDAKIDQAVRLNRRALADRTLERADRAVTRHAWTVSAELALGALAAILSGSFLAAHGGEPRFLVPGLALHAFVIGQLAAAVRHVVRARAVDYAAPLAEVQRRVAALQVSMARWTAWTLALAPLVWTPLFIVGLKGLFGVDAYAALGIPYVAANLALGVAVAVAGVFVSRRYAGQLSPTSLGGRVSRALAGRDLAAAAAHLEAVAAFERED